MYCLHFELCIVLGLKEMLVKLMENIFAEIHQYLFHFSMDFYIYFFFSCSIE